MQVGKRNLGIERTATVSTEVTEQYSGILNLTHVISLLFMIDWKFHASLQEMLSTGRAASLFGRTAQSANTKRWQKAREGEVYVGTEEKRAELRDGEQQGIGKDGDRF